MLKGNKYGEEEKQVYEQFLTLLHASQTHLHETFREDRIDACHDYLKTKLAALAGRSPRNGSPTEFCAESPDGKRFIFGAPVYKPAKNRNDSDSDEDVKKFKEEIAS